RRAALIASVAGMLILPPRGGIDVPGLPPFGKETAIIAGILLGCLAFDSGRLLAFRPRWFDLPMLLFCLCPYASSISNDLVAYDGLSAAYRQSCSWLLPYLIGRLYLTDVAAFRDLAMDMIVSGACIMIPICLVESQLHTSFAYHIYGLASYERRD